MPFGIAVWGTKVVKETNFLMYLKKNTDGIRSLFLLRYQFVTNFLCKLFEGFFFLSLLLFYNIFANGNCLSSSFTQFPSFEGKFPLGHGERCLRARLKSARRCYRNEHGGASGHISTGTALETRCLDSGSAR